MNVDNVNVLSLASAFSTIAMAIFALMVSIVNKERIRNRISFYLIISFSVLIFYGTGKALYDFYKGGLFDVGRVSFPIFSMGSVWVLLILLFFFLVYIIYNWKILNKGLVLWGSVFFAIRVFSIIFGFWILDEFIGLILLFFYYSLIMSVLE